MSDSCGRAREVLIAAEIINSILLTHLKTHHFPHIAPLFFLLDAKNAINVRCMAQISLFSLYNVKVKLFYQILDVSLKS